MVKFEALWQGAGGYWNVVIAAALIMLPLIAIVYMVGRAIGREELTAWSKDEFYQLFGSFFIIGSVIVLLIFINTFALNLLFAGGFNCSTTGCTFDYNTLLQCTSVKLTKTC